jgi:hypothetical protein
LVPREEPNAIDTHVEDEKRKDGDDEDGATGAAG